MTRKLLLPFVLLGLIFITGCSDKVHIGGKVTFSDDNSPVTFGTVEFSTPSFRTEGQIKSDGTYVIGTDTLTDGISKGTYGITVRVDEVTMIDQPDGSQTPSTRSLIDSKYHSVETSGLTFTVDGKTRKFDIPVDRAK